MFRLVLGSATPSLESMANAVSGRYGHLKLKSRAGSAKMPKIEILDLNRLAVNDGLSAPVVGAIGDRISRGEQSLVFVNRRGFAPVVVCYRMRLAGALPTLRRQANPAPPHRPGYLPPLRESGFGYRRSARNVRHRAFLRCRRGDPAGRRGAGADFPHGPRDAHRQRCRWPSGRDRPGA